MVVIDLISAIVHSDWHQGEVAVVSYSCVGSTGCHCDMYNYVKVTANTSVSIITVINSLKWFVPILTQCEMNI